MRSAQGGCRTSLGGDLLDLGVVELPMPSRSLGARKAFKTHYLTPLKIAFGVWALWAPRTFFFFVLAMPSPRPGAKKKKNWNLLDLLGPPVGQSGGLLEPPGNILGPSQASQGSQSSPEPSGAS